MSSNHNEIRVTAKDAFGNFDRWHLGFQNCRHMLDSIKSSLVELPALLHFFKNRSSAYFLVSRR